MTTISTVPKTQFSGFFKVQLTDKQRHYLSKSIHLGPSIMRKSVDSKETREVWTSPSELMKKALKKRQSGYRVQLYQISEFNHWHATAHVFKTLAEEGFVKFYDAPMPSRGTVAVGYGNYIIEITRKGRQALKNIDT